MARLFQRVRLQHTAQMFQEILGDAYAPKRKEVTAVYVGSNQISINGQRYPFQDRDSIQPSVGQSLPVRNIGRKAAAIYAPADADTEIT